MDYVLKISAAFAVALILWIVIRRRSPTHARNDRRDIQGLWRLLHVVSRGRPVGTAETHRVFAGSSTRQVTPHVRYEGDTTVETRFELFQGERPARIVEHSRWIEPDGTVAKTITETQWYRLYGDSLYILSRGDNQPPPRISDEHGTLWEYVRELNPREIERYSAPPRRERRPELDDAALGTLHWDANFTWWQGTIRLGNADDAELFVKGPQVIPADVLNQAARVVDKVRSTIGNIEQFVAQRMLDLKNGEWLDENEERLDEARFCARLSVESVSIDPKGGVEIWFDDGDLFFGHGLCVTLDDDLEPASVEMHG